MRRLQLQPDQGCMAAWLFDDDCRYYFEQ